ncbi:MAG: CPBP family intramembrane glutamic endopeptidase [Thermoanaerobaculia bacterium]|nr:CPBP family intramembrane glutamic endopeptidase [Thermoanaerobaculia bacterium]
MSEPDQAMTDDERAGPSRDLGTMSVGPVLFVSGIYLILEIGTSLAVARNSHSSPIATISSGVLTIEIIVAAMEIGLVVALLAMERVHPAAAGIRFGKMPSGLLLGFVVWGLSQLLMATVALARHGSFSLYLGWAEPAAMFAPLLEHFLTDVFAEEIFWRGVFFLWIIRSLEKRSWGSPLARLGAGLVGSQLLFGISKLPSHILDPTTPAIPPGGALLVFTVSGMFYALIYLRTANLWLVMAIHSLTLWPVPLFAFDLDPSRLTVLVAAVLLIPIGQSIYTLRSGKGRSAGEV